jgi:hypothetical protein
VKKCRTCSFLKQTEYGERCTNPDYGNCPVVLISLEEKKVSKTDVKPTLHQMAEHFAKAMSRWAKKGCKIVSKEEYQRRRLICNECAGGWRCPKCGCMLWAKAALLTETCDKWKVQMGKNELFEKYKGQTCYLVLNGPSVESVNMDFLKDKITMAVNNGGLIKPTFWTAVDRANKFDLKIWQDPDIIKFVPEGKRNATLDKETHKKVEHMPHVNFFRVVHKNINEWFEDGIVWKVRHNNKSKISVMFAAMNLLCKMGFTTIFLVGADFKMTLEKPYFFKWPKDDRGVRQNNALYKFQNEVFTSLRPILEEKGITVFNCTAGSGLTAFDYRPLERT